MIQFRQGDCRKAMARLPEKSVHCVITSPPYFGLRDYGLKSLVWGDGAWRGSLGLEMSHSCLGWATGNACEQCYVCHIVEVFRSVKRVLRDDGTCFIVIGDSYAGGKGNLKSKNLCLIPSHVALALQADGWYVRNTAIWAKPNPMPESVRNRFTRSHEVVLVLSKQRRYFWDQEAVKEASTERPSGNSERRFDYLGGRYGVGHSIPYTPNGTGRNRRDVLTIPTQPFSAKKLGFKDVDHFATMPEKLVEIAIQAGSSEKGCCPECSAPWQRIIEKVPRETPYTYIPVGIPGESQQRGRRPGAMKPSNAYEGQQQRKRCNTIPGGTKKVTLGLTHLSQTQTVRWEPSCTCSSASPVPCTLLDPFGGSGTVGVVADRLDRHAVLIDQNPQYVKIARARVTQQKRLARAS